MNVNGSGTERLAVNLYDLDRVVPSLRAALVSPRLDPKPVDMSYDRKGGDEVAVAFSCDLLSAAMICDTLRSHDRAAGDQPTRLYLHKATAWTRIASNIVLTEEDGKGGYRLNPSVFPRSVEPAKPVPLAGGRVA